MAGAGLAGAFLGKYRSAGDEEPGKARVRSALKVLFPALLLAVLAAGVRAYPWYGVVALLAGQAAVVSLFRKLLLTEAEHAASDAASRRVLEERIEAARAAGDRKQEEVLLKLKDRLGKWL